MNLVGLLWGQFETQNSSAVDDERYHARDDKTGYKERSDRIEDGVTRILNKQSGNDDSDASKSIL